MISLAMNGTRTLSLALTLSLLLVGALPASAQAPARGDLVGASTELSGWLPVRLVCESCTEESAPSVAALWRFEDGSDARRTLRTVSWSEGLFSWDAADGTSSPLQGHLLDDGSHGWTVALPLHGQGRPFRVLAQLPGFTSERVAFWPSRDELEILSVDFQPIDDFFEQHPQWSTERTVECDLLVPRSNDEAITFFASGRPVAWLYGHPDAELWSFQFVRPGGTLLDRVTVPVRPSDEGDHLGFRLPLSGLLGGEAEGRVELGEHEGLRSSEGRPVAVQVGEAGVVNLADCPRIPAELLEPELQTEGG